jgi:hypothetical protein
MHQPAGSRDRTRSSADEVEKATSQPGRVVDGNHGRFVTKVLSEACRHGGGWTHLDHGDAAVDRENQAPSRDERCSEWNREPVSNPVSLDPEKNIIVWAGSSTRASCCAI